MTIEEKLQDLNINSQQAKLYLAALQLSSASVAELALKAGVERTACYPHLKKLVKIGLLSVALKKDKTVFIAENPKKINEILEEKKNHFNKLMPDLLAIFNAKDIKPKVRYYEGREGMKNILLNSIKSGSKENLHLNPFNNVIEVLGKDFARHYIETRVKNKINVRSLRLQEEVQGSWEFKTKDQSILREVRYLPKDFNLDNLIIIYNNTIAIISSVKENYGLEIESKELSNTMRSVFEILWKITKNNL